VNLHPIDHFVFPCFGNIGGIYGYLMARLDQLTAEGFNVIFYAPDVGRIERCNLKDSHVLFSVRSCTAFSNGSLVELWDIAIVCH
jgi:hypothetical protein